MIPSAAELGGIGREIAALRAGDPGPLRDWLTAPAPGGDERFWGFLWREVCTLTGRVVGSFEVVQGDRRYRAVLGYDLPVIAGGPPRVVTGIEMLSSALAAALAEPIGVEPHRRNALATLRSLPALPLEESDAAAALLRHHTDLPVDILAGRRPIGSAQDVPAEAEMLAPLADVLAGPEAFHAHLQAGTEAPSAPRRDLSSRLLGI